MPAQRSLAGAKLPLRVRDPEHAARLQQQLFGVIPAAVSVPRRIAPGADEGARPVDPARQAQIRSGGLHRRLSQGVQRGEVGEQPDGAIV